MLNVKTDSSEDNDKVCDEIEYADKEDDQVIEVNDKNSQEECEENSKTEEVNIFESSK